MLTWPFGLPLCLCIYLCGLRDMFPFHLRSKCVCMPFGSNLIPHLFSTRHGVSDLVRNFFFIYVISVMCSIASGSQCRNFKVLHSLAIAYRRCVVSSHFKLRIDTIWLRALPCLLFFLRFEVRRTRCFISFNFLTSCSIAEKM